MVKSVIRNYHWPPNIIGGFFIDDWDYEGLIYWYNDVKEQSDELKPKKK